MNHLPRHTVGERGYLEALWHILKYGYEVENDRTGTGTINSPTPLQIHFPLVEDNFPLFTTKYVSFNMLACEMLWFISGSTHTDDLEEIGSSSMKNMWDKWSKPKEAETGDIVKVTDLGNIKKSAKENISLPTTAKVVEDYGHGEIEVTIDDEQFQIYGHQYETDKTGELGRIYGKQWRKWTSGTNNRPEVKSLDQLGTLIWKLRNRPTSRRHVITAWNPAELDEMALPPCHVMYQFRVQPLTEQDKKNIASDELEGKGEATAKELLEATNIPDYKLHLHLTMRSIDMFLGAPFNIAQYALLLVMVSKVVGMKPGDFTWTGVEPHIYGNHIEQVKTQIKRELFEFPQLVVPEKDSIDDYEREDLKVSNYNHHPKIEAEVSV